MLDDDARNGQIAEPLVIGWNDEPGRMLGAAARKRVFIGGHVVFPVDPLLIIGLADLPLFARVVEALLEALQLLLFRNVQIELENVGLVRNQILLEFVDQFIAPRPDIFWDEIVNANDKNILVVRTVEYYDFAASRRGLVRAPQKIMRSLLGGRLFERRNAATLRVHGA